MLKMENNSTYYIDLITRYFTGEANEEEILLISSWLKYDTKFLELFEEYKSTWNILEINIKTNDIDIDEEWDKFKLKVYKPSIHNITEFDNLNLVNKNIFSTRTFYYKAFRIAAIFIFVLLCSIIIYRTFSNNEPVIIYAKLDTVEKKLPDGTSVTLNTGSSVEYPKIFKVDKREVKFKGEAYFKVAHDSNKPFVIHSDKIRIEVLGTSFYVNTNAENGNIEVILNSGKVAVYSIDNPSSKIFLEPGQKALASVSKLTITKSLNDDQNYMAWETKKIVFVNDPLSEIVRTLNKVYHSNIQIKENKISDCRISVSFDHQSLSSVLKVLQATINIDIKQVNSGIELSGKGCEQ
jgi:transmembrane sensor